MSLKALLAYSLFALDVVAALSLRAVEPFEDLGSYVGYSLPKGFYVKRQTLGCPVGTRQCARIGSQIACAAVCCYEGGVFTFGCDAGYACSGTGAGAGCCPIGQTCAGGPPPCVDNGELAPGTTTACPATAPVCTSNAAGAPICSGSRTLSFTLTSTLTSDFTTTADTETTTSTMEETTSTTIMETTTSVSTTSTMSLMTSTLTTEIPEETSTSETMITETSTTTETTTSYVAPTRNSTITPPPQATSSSSRTFTMNIMLGLIGVAAAFFLF